MQSYIFLDLDDTLFQTLRKCELGADDPDLIVRACLPDGEHNSFATLKQQWLWNWLNQGFKIVPVTARDYHAFQRVNLPFQEEVVLNHGAVILNKHGEVDQNWQESIVSSLPNYLEQLHEVWVLIESYAQQVPTFKTRLVQDFGMTWYGVIKHVSGQEAPLQTLLDLIVKPHAAINNGSLYWHLNGNNLAILPKIINKADAVQYLLETYRQAHPHLLTFGAGDSHTDAPFMSLCDYALIPKNTQLFNHLKMAGEAI